MPEEWEPRFIVDNNVGKLAKWLRVLGYDAIFINPIDDEELIRLALAQGRILLTRDRRIAGRRMVTTGRLKAILIQDEDWRGQLRQVVSTLKLNGLHRPFSRCVECNVTLVEKDKGTVEELVPPFVYRTQENFRECPFCHKIYWRGTHWEKMMGELSGLDQSDSPGQ